MIEDQKILSTTISGENGRIQILMKMALLIVRTLLQVGALTLIHTPLVTLHDLNSTYYLSQIHSIPIMDFIFALFFCVTIAIRK